MKKIKNKFIILIFILISFIIFIGIYNSYFVEIDRSTFAILLDGKGLVNDKSLVINQKEKLNEGDIVKTIGDESIAVIEWGDGSVTRLGGNSSIEVKELYVDDDLLKINLSFKLLSGKSWSNVINFMGEGSYFKESFRDIEAGVRGTTFNVDLDNDYVSVIKHKISLLDVEGKIYSISEKQPFSLKTFSFIKLEEFIRNFKDKSFDELNRNLDNEFLKVLTQNLKDTITQFESLSNINVDALSQENREKLFNELMTKYQKLNIVGSDSGELFSKKIEYKKILINLAGEQEKETLIENTLYDFGDTIDSKNVEGFEQILPILNENIDIVNKLKINFSDYFKSPVIPEGLKNSFSSNIETLENIFNVNLEGKVTNIDIEKLKSLKNNIEEKIEDNLDTNLENAKSLIDKAVQTKDDLKNSIENKLEENINTDSFKSGIEGFKNLINK